MSEQSQVKYGSLVLAMMLSSITSVSASIAVVRISFLKLQSTYQRFLFMLATANALNSFFLFWHPILIPRDELHSWSIGNESSCIASGFFFMFGSLSVCLYYSCLSLYFFFSIHAHRKSAIMSEDVIGPSEFAAHILCWLLPITVASFAAGTQSIGFDRKTDLCLPQRPCSASAVDCTKGVLTGEYITYESDVIMLTFQAIIVVGSLLGLICTMRISLQAWEVGHRTINDQDAEISEPIKQRIQAVSKQSLLYSLVYFNSFIWLFVAFGKYGDADSTTYYAFQFLAFSFFPLQGTMYCIVYIRPRYQMLRVMYPDDPATVVLRVSLSTAGDPDEIEHVRAAIFGDAYVPPPSVASSCTPSRDSDLPETIQFDPNCAISVGSAVSTPDGTDEQSSSLGKDLGKEDQ